MKMFRELRCRSAIFGVLAVLAVLAVTASPAASAKTPQAAAATAGARGECSSTPSRILGHSVPYCVVLPPGYDAKKTRRYPVLYYLHGLGDNERMLLRSGGFTLIEDLWQQHQIGEFVIVTPAAGASFYINARDGHRPYEDFLLQEFLPSIERRYRIQPGRAARGIGGISMGGYGALHLAFQHPELFASVSVQSAALIERLPSIRVGDSPEGGLLNLFGDVFGSPLDRAFWDRNNPLTLARTADLSRLKIYFDCGTEDDYGFNAGAQVLHNLLASRHVIHEFHLYPGGHNWEFFGAHLPASLAFQSHAFAGAAARGDPQR